MDVGGDFIWGDDSESEVFAQAQSRDVCIIFRYSWNPKFPQSLPSRIVTCFHGLPAEDACETFPNRGSMREALYSSIRGLWDQCTRHPSVTAADVIVEIYEDAERQNQWRISHESLYNQYVESLLLVGSLFRGGEAKRQAYNAMDYSSLVQIRHLGGRGRTALVRSSETLYVFKGVDFGAFLESRTDFKHQKDVCYHEIRTISSLPPHPNIIPLSDTFVTLERLCGRYPRGLERYCESLSRSRSERKSWIIGAGGLLENGDVQRGGADGMRLDISIYLERFLPKKQFRA
ncbi:MAG: hypothetical protein Q9185_003345 [Variospora sp. 1 TL-2023]